MRACREPLSNRLPKNVACQPLALYSVKGSQDVRSARAPELDALCTTHVARKQARASPPGLLGNKQRFGNSLVVIAKRLLFLGIRRFSSGSPYLVADDNVPEITRPSC